MKKIIISGLVLLILFACTSTPGMITQEDRTAIDAVVDRWVTALQQKDLDGLADTYWPDFVHTTKDENGTVVETVQGIEDFKSKTQGMFDQGDFYKLIVYSDPQRDFDSEPGEPIYKIFGKLGEGEWAWQDIFQLIKRNGEWRIIDHILIVLP
jgi:SnoaL-like domain